MYAGICIYVYICICVYIICMFTSFTTCVEFHKEMHIIIHLLHIIFGMIFSLTNYDYLDLRFIPG